MLSEPAKGLALIIASIFLLQLSLDLMQDHDDAEKEFQRECDPGYRALIGNMSSIDSELCSELDRQRSRQAIEFITSLAFFVITGLVGTVMVLPSNEN